MLDELRTNARLRLGAALALGLLIVSLLLDAQAALKTKRMEAARLQERLGLLTQSAQDSAWLERAKSARALRERIEAGLWTAADAGVAEASFVDWMNRQLAEAKVGRPSVLSAIPTTGRIDLPATPGGTQLLRLNVGFDFAPGAAEQVLERLASSGRFVVVESMSVRRVPTPRIELLLATAARVTSPAGEERKR